MDLPKRKDDELDAILEELKSDGQPLPRVDNALLDEILAGLASPEGTASSPEPLMAAAGGGQAPPRPGPAGTQMPLAQPAPAQASSAPGQAATPDSPPAMAGDAPAAQASPENAGAETGAAGETETPPMQAAGEEAKPADATAEEGPARKKKKKGDVEATGIWAVDPDTLHTEHMPRVGKAAALDKMQPGKFTDDTQLQDWFSGSGNMVLSKKEQKQAEKERKRQLAAERREAKRSAKKSPGAEEKAASGAPLIEEDPAPEENSAAGAERTADAATGAPDMQTAVAAVQPPPAPEFEEPAATPEEKPAAPEEATTAAETAAPSPAAAPEPAPPSGTEPLGLSEPAATLHNAPAAAAQPQTGHAVQAANGNAGEPLFLDGTQPGVTAPAEIDAEKLSDTREFPPETEEGKPTGNTQEFLPGTPAEKQPAPPDNPPREPDAKAAAPGGKNLYVDEMVDHRFREFFSETVIVERDELAAPEEEKPRRRRQKKGRNALITGEFGKLAEESEEAEMAGEELENDYNRPQDAAAVERDILSLRRNLLFRTLFSVLIGAGLLYMAIGFVGGVPLPAFMSPATNPVTFGIVYLGLLVLVIGVNFTTVAAGLVGLFGEPSVDSATALASVAVLLQGVVLLVQVLTQGPVNGTLFGGVAALLLAGNALGKRVRAGSVLNNFRVVSSGTEHAAAYVLDNSNEMAYHITKGLDEAAPALLISRPTALVKGFLRQSFSPRWSDRIGRILGWCLFGAGILAGIFIFFKSNMDLMMALSGFAAVLCLGSPLSSALVNAVPSGLLQRSANRLGAVVPGWSAIEELGQVNVVMATARDIFPAGTVRLRGIKTFQKERIDYAILYAASVLAEGCDTLRDLFLGMVENKTEMLYKVENLQVEAGRGFTAWVENNRIVIGTREMLQKHDIDPPAMEVEVQHVTDGALPIYLAVSGKLYAMFVVDYRPDLSVSDTLDGLVKSGVSLLVTSTDMNVSSELIEQVYRLPHGTVKVLGRRELDLMGPLTDYLPESDGVMTHRGAFSSFIGGMRAAAGCAAAERMATSVQIASVVLAVILSLVLVFLGETSNALAGLALYIPLLYQLAWTLLVCALPFTRRY